jgi:hypothetical protein
MEFYTDKKKLMISLGLNKGRGLKSLKKKPFGLPVYRIMLSDLCKTLQNISMWESDGFIVVS